MRIIASPFGKVYLWGRGAGSWHSLESHCQRQLFGPSCFGFDPTTARSFPSFLLTQKKSVIGWCLKQLLGVFKALFLGPKNTLLTSFIYFFYRCPCPFFNREVATTEESLSSNIENGPNKNNPWIPSELSGLVFWGQRSFTKVARVAYFRIDGVFLVREGEFLPKCRKFFGIFGWFARRFSWWSLILGLIDLGIFFPLIL